MCWLKERSQIHLHYLWNYNTFDWSIPLCVVVCVQQLSRNSRCLKWKINLSLCVYTHLFFYHYSVCVTLTINALYIQDIGSMPQIQEDECLYMGMPLSQLNRCLYIMTHELRNSNNLTPGTPLPAVGSGAPVSSMGKRQLDCICHINRPHQ